MDGADTRTNAIPPTDRHEIESTHEEIAVADFQPGRSIREVIFIAPSRCRAIHGFNNFVRLFRIVIPRSVEVVDQWGFYGCRSLTDLTFESGSHLTWISGFRSCTALARIAIPSSVEVIRVAAFYRCTSLVEVIFECGSRLKSIDGFGDCKSLRQITLPPSLETLDFWSFCRCTSLRDVIFEPGSGIKAIKGFRGCTSLSRIALPPSLQSLQSVHWRAFIEFDSLHALRSVFGTRVPADATLRKIKCFVTYPDESLKAKRRGFSMGFVWRNVSGGLLSLK
jgi:hypothetical protein